MSALDTYSPILQRALGGSAPITNDEPDVSPILSRAFTPKRESDDAEPQPLDGLLQIGGGQNVVGGSGESGSAPPIPANPNQPKVGESTPFFDPEAAIRGDHGPKWQSAYTRAKAAVDKGRSRRFPWSEIVANTPEDERNETLLAISQLSHKRGEYDNKGTIGKVGTAVVRGARQFKNSVDNTLGEAVEMVFGKTDIPGVEVVDGWGDSERLFEKAAERAAEQGDPLVNPDDPFWQRWTVQAAEMTPPMAAGLMPGGLIGKGHMLLKGTSAASIWFPAIYDDSRDELLEAGVDPDTARVAGAMSAAVQAAVETFNLNPFKPKGGADPVARGIREHVANYVKGWSKELSEEFVQGGVQGATMAAATALDEQAPDLALGDQLLQKFSDAMQAGGPLAVVMLPGFIGGLPASRRESMARRWMANATQEQVERVAEKAEAGEQVPRTAAPGVKSAAARNGLGEEVVKQKPKYRWNPKTGAIEPKADIQPPAEGHGRPELANPGMTQPARDMMDDIDQDRKEAGVPEVESRAEVEEIAKQRLEADYEGEVAKVLEGGAEPGAINTFLAREAFNTEATKAVRGDFDALIRANRLGEEYRARRTEVARELGAGVDPILTPEQRLGHVMRAAAEVPGKIAKKIERYDQVAKRTRKERRNVQADIDDAWKRLGAAFGGQLGANNVQAVAEATKAAGDLVVAYARKGVYAVEDIIADLEAKNGVKLNDDVRGAVETAYKDSRDTIRAERVRNEDARVQKREKQVAKNREKGDNLIRQWGQSVEQYKADLKRIHGIDLDSAEGLTNLEAATALQYLRAYKSDAIDVWLEYRRNAMLSAPDTHMLNNTSNTSHFMYLFGLRYPTEVAGRALKGDKSLKPEVEAVYRNLFSMMNLRDAFRTAKLAFATEIDVWELREAERGQEAQEKFVSPVDIGGRGVSVKGRKGRVLRTPQRALLAADNFYKVMMGRAYVAMEAHRVATAEGYDLRAEPEAYDQRVQALMADTSSEAWESATHLVREGVFQEPTRAMNWLNSLRSSEYGRLWQLIIPFVTTPWNVMRRAAKMTPGVGTAGLVFDFKSGNAKRISKGLADQAIGAAGWMLLAAYNDPDNEDALFRFTGTENGMRKRKALIDTSLHQPNSLYIGKHRIGLNRFDPFATWLGVAVDTIEEAKRSKHPADAFKIAATYMTSAARAMQNKTWLQGISDLFELMGRISDGEYRGSLEYWSRSFTVSHVPNIFKAASRDADPYMRDMRIWGEGQDRFDRLLESARIQAGFDTDKDEWSYDLWGMPRRIQEINDAPATDFVMRLLSPFPQNQQEPFIGTQILMRWNMENPDDAYWPGQPSLKYNKDGKKVYMDPEQKAQFMRLSGRLAKNRVTEHALAKPPSFSPIDKLRKADKERIKAIISGSRAAMRKRLSMEWRVGNTIDDETIMKEYGIQIEP